MGTKIESAATLAARFGRRAKRITNLGEEAQKLRRNRRITAGSYDAIFESSHLSLVTSFEVFVEELFFSSLLGRSGIDAVCPRLAFNSRGDAERVVRGERGYVGWLPFEKKVLKTSEVYFSSSPFERLNRHSAEFRALNEITVVRNRIAHDSASARAVFDPLASHLRARNRTPAGLLQERRQGVTSLERYSLELQKISLALSATTIREAKALLSPESPHQRGSKPGVGIYECTRCGTPERIGPRKNTLPSCRTCMKLGTTSKATWRPRY